MATKPKAAASPPETVAISRGALKALLAFYNAAEAADAAYQSCQSTLYRNFVRGAQRAANTQRAAEEARRLLGEE